MLVLQNGNSTQINDYLKRVKTIADKDYNEKHKEENKEAEKHLVVFIYYSGHGTKEGGDTLICGTDGGLVNIDNEIRGICNKNVTVVAVIDSAREEKKEAKDFPAYKQYKDSLIVRDDKGKARIDNKTGNPIEKKHTGKGQKHVMYSSKDATRRRAAESSFSAMTEEWSSMVEDGVFTYPACISRMNLA